MSNILGIDLGGTSLDYVLATDNGDILYEKSFDSPFKTTSKQLPDGKPEVFIDTIFKDVPNELKVQTYIAQTESEFLKEVKCHIGKTEIKRKGYSLCGKTWTHDGKIVIIGGNTPSRFATNLGNNRIGIIIVEPKTDVFVEASNDGNAAATAQGIYYKVIKGIDPVETGYFILGTGFGFGVPKYFALTEIGHMPVGFVPKIFWQRCGCNDYQKTACAEHFVSGRGIQTCATILLSLKNQEILKGISDDDHNLIELVKTSKLRNHNHLNSKIIMDYAKNNLDGLSNYITDIAAEVTAYAAITAAQLFGLQLIGIGESIACQNPWHIENISRKVDSYVKGNTILRPSLKVELTPLKNPSKYGALSLVIPESRYEIWVKKMEKN